MYENQDLSKSSWRDDSSYQKPIINSVGTYTSEDTNLLEKMVDYELLDEVLKSVLFFQSFGKETRLKLYKKFKYEHIPQKTIIFVEENLSLKQLKNGFEQNKNINPLYSQE